MNIILNRMHFCDTSKPTNSNETLHLFRLNGNER